MNKDTIHSIAQRIKITILNQGFFNTKRQHGKETREENRRHGLSDDVEVYVKLIKHPALSKAHSIKSKIYTTHKKLTFPSPVDGLRIVPAGKEWDHAAKVGELQGDFDKEVELFLADYDNIVADAPRRLGSLYDATMFPSKREMQGKFYNTIRYMECPTGGSWDDWIGETAEVVNCELRDKIVGATRKLIERCTNDDGRLFAAVFDNVANICETAIEFNLMEDPIIAHAAKELRTVATDFSVEVLRDNKGLRRATAERANRILSALNLA